VVARSGAGDTPFEKLSLRGGVREKSRNLFNVVFFEGTGRCDGVEGGRPESQGDSALSDRRGSR